MDVEAPSTYRLPADDALHLRAAQFWLALGKIDEAHTELEDIGPARREHPAVLEMQRSIESQRLYINTMINDRFVLEPFWDKN